MFYIDSYCQNCKLANKCYINKCITEIVHKLNEWNLSEIDEDIPSKYKYKTIENNYDSNIKFIESLGMSEIDFIMNCMFAKFNKDYYDYENRKKTSEIVDDYELAGRDITRDKLRCRQDFVNKTKKYGIDDARKPQYTKIK